MPAGHIGQSQNKLFLYFKYPHGVTDNNPSLICWVQEFQSIRHQPEFYRLIEQWIIGLFQDRTLWSALKTTITTVKGAAHHAPANFKSYLAERLAGTYITPITITIPPVKSAGITINRCAAGFNFCCTVGYISAALAVVKIGWGTPIGN